MRQLLHHLADLIQPATLHIIESEKIAALFPFYVFVVLEGATPKQGTLQHCIVVDGLFICNVLYAHHFCFF